MTIDLHVHSTYSDGSMSPSELMLLAQKKGLSAIAITDHDTIDGIDEAFSVSQSLALDVIPGVELSVKYGDLSVHLLGYMFERKDPALLDGLKMLQTMRLERNLAILQRLDRIGIVLEVSDLERISMHGQTGRPHIAQLLVQKGIVETMDEAFTSYLAKGGMAYVPRKVFDSQEAINLIKNSGGLVILAHPQQLEKNGHHVEKIIIELQQQGLDGLEVYYPNHSRQFRKKLVVIAKKRNLIISGGSDYHGTFRLGTTLAGGKNCSVPESLLTAMKQRHAELYQDKEIQDDKGR